MKISIKAKSEGTMKTVVKARQFQLIVDEPENLGGKDEGANPVEFVLAALAGCFSVVGKVVASEMGFELKGMDIELEGDLNPARFMGKSFDDRAGFKSINAIIKVDADIDDKTKAEWAKKCEERCPVSDNLINPTPISFKIK